MQKLHPAEATLWCAVGLLIGLVLDSLVSGGWGMSPLYLLPVVPATISMGGRHGVVVAAIGALVSGLSALVSGTGGSLLSIAVAAVASFGCFSLVATLMGRLCLAYDRERTLSRHDPLTGVPDRSLFFERIEMLATMSRRGVEASRLRPFALMSVEMEGVETLTEVPANNLRRCTARLLVEAVRGTDVVARNGTDEFVVLCSFVEPDRLEILLGKLESALKAALDGAGDGLGYRIGLILLPELPTSFQATMAAIARAKAAIEDARSRGERIGRVAEEGFS